jgi:hypothetical protein
MSQGSPKIGNRHPTQDLPPGGDEEGRRPAEPGGAEPIDAAGLLPGSVFMVPDKTWGFEAPGRVDHPGACLDYPPVARECGILKGSTPSWAARWKPTYIVEPSPGNGLRKRTAFDLVPVRIRKHRLRLMYPERWIGRLDDQDFGEILRELRRLFPHV